MKKAIQGLMMEMSGNIEMVMKTKMVAKSIVGDYCDMDMMDDDMSDVMMGLDMMNGEMNRDSMNGDMMSDMMGDDMMGDNMPDTCEYWPKEPQCNHHGASECMNTNDLMFLLSNVDFFGKETLCV